MDPVEPAVLPGRREAVEADPVGLSFAPARVARLGYPRVALVPVCPALPVKIAAIWNEHSCSAD